MNFKNKKGSASVFFMMITVSLIGMILMFIHFSKIRAVDSAIESLGNLWAESITGEYDVNLFNQYKLFGFRSNCYDVNFKVKGMASYSFDGKKYIKDYIIDSDLYEYSLSLPAVFRMQVIKAGQMIKADNDRDISNNSKKRIIQNKAILNALPSKSSEVSAFDIDIKEAINSISSLEEIAKNGGQRFFINNYIKYYFKNSLNDKGLGETYFHSEIEYLIGGKFSDEKNEDAVRNRIIAMREILNMKYLTTDPEKNSALAAAAEILTPGPQAEITKQALKASWAFAESINDYKLLKAGKRVEFIKSDSSWAVDLESVLNNSTSGYIDTGHDVGNDYGDYLCFFTMFMSEEILLLRMMDIIQINMSYIYDDSFMLQDCSAGVRINMKVDGRDYAFISKYN